LVKRNTLQLRMLKSEYASIPPEVRRFSHDQAEGLTGLRTSVITKLVV
jgi:hypothetical protein